MLSSNNPLGSVSALSIAANPVALPVIATVAGVGITVAAAVYTYKAYQRYEEAKHRQEIEKINRLHERYLARIFIRESNEIQGFPIIFKLTQDKDSSKAESLHYTDDEIRNIGTMLPHGTDIALSVYRQAILNALLKLKEYYFSRTERYDITAGVLSYLLHMLQTRMRHYRCA